MEKNILSAFIADRGSYDRLIEYVEEDDFEGVSKLILHGITEYYETDSTANSVDVSTLATMLVRKYPRFEDDIGMVLESLGQVSVKNVTKEFVAHKKAVIGHKLATALQTGRTDGVPDLIANYTRYTDVEAVQSGETEFNGDISHLFSIGEANKKRDFVFKPKALQDATKGADRGNHILIFGRPNSGKSLLSINTASGFLMDGHKVLYIGNEDPLKQMMFRFICRMSNTAKDDVIKDLDKHVKEAYANGLNNLVFKEMVGGSFREFRALAKKYKPDVIVIDQIRNVNMKGEGLTNKLELASIEARNLAKEYDCLVVSVTQAGESAKGKLVLTMEDIDSSKTGLQAALDCMIGVGVNEAYDRAGRRMISVVKNKLGGIPDSQFPIKINPAMSKAIGGENQ